MPGEVETLRWQFGLAWRLAELHLPRLTDEACRWEPAPGSWTVRRSPDGRWRPDWTVPEPDPAPPATIAWLSWHLVWWWSGALAAIEGAQPPSHEAVDWPGSAAAVRARIESLAQAWDAWLSRLDEAELLRPIAYPWPEPRPLGRLLAWANVELMKNVVEIGYVRHLFEASKSRRGEGAPE